MALQFVLGSSGSGKTEYIYERLVRQAGEHPKKNYLVIVPEQFTMQTQQKLVELAPNHAIMNIDVLSFKRLAYRVFDDMGMQDIQVLEETGKNLVLRRLAQEQEETLTVLRANMNRMGYIGEVKSMISELVQYRISPEQLVDLTEDKTISPVLSAKLRDVATMYRAFCDFMKDSFVTAEEILNVLKNLVPQSETLRDAVLVFDEFTGFTPIQNDLMRELLQVTEHIYITLTIDAAEDFYHCSGNEELFALSKKTILSLMKMAEELHVQVMEPVVMTDSAHKRFKLAPALAFMEQNLFRPRPAKYTKPVEEIHLAAVKKSTGRTDSCGQADQCANQTGIPLSGNCCGDGRSGSLSELYGSGFLRNMRFHILWIRPKKCYFIRSLNVFVPRLKLWIRILVMRQSCAFCGVDSVILRRTIWTGWTVIWLQPVSAAKRRGADDGGICHGRKRFTIWNSSKNSGKKYMGILSRLQQYLPEKMPVFRMASGHCMSC